MCMVPSGDFSEEVEDGTQAVRGILFGMAFGGAAWVGLLLALFFLVGCGRPAEAEPERARIRLELAEAERATETEEILREAAMEKIIDYLTLGALVARYNPRLTSQEQFQLGRAIAYYADAYGLDPMLVVAVIAVESEGNVRAKSRKGAIGLMQVMPDWPQRLGIAGDLYDIDFNVRIGSFILAENVRRYGIETGLRVYVAGTVNHDARQAHEYLAKVKNAYDDLRG